MIALGTVCYLVGLVDRPELEGLVVEVVGYDFSDNEGAWNVITGSALDQAMPGHECQARDANLRPIAHPTADDLAKAHRRVPANEH